ncbi:hypothetical protein KQI89_15710 [Clostridium sp. MSJ-4]|uniref:Uncharacterized protein n=1 Tax=Clostridium simiarum TaxID=2841506 RepID=A0ABS6F5U4_9CLOT|nr:hypothetical protein [Clostridium simiarum]MBU5593195.1 hypothetical protein [Clostridium simiarum]
MLKKLGNIIDRLFDARENEIIIEDGFIMDKDYEKEACEILTSMQSNIVM